MTMLRSLRRVSRPALGRAARRLAHQPSGLSADELRGVQQVVSSPAALSRTSLPALQGALGNRAVQRLVTTAQALSAPARPRPRRDEAAAEAPADGSLQRKGVAGANALVLQQGSSGPAVETIQQQLNDHGAELEVDGIFGPLTHAAVVAFQQSHQDGDGEQLKDDGKVGPKTRFALGQSAGGAPAPAPDGKSPADTLREIFAKGDGITPEEAKQAQALLFSLEGDDFRAVMKEAMASGAFMSMLMKLDLGDIIATLSNLTQEVVVPTTLLRPAPDTIDDDFKRANEIYGPHGIEIERGEHLEIDEATSKLLLGKDEKLDNTTDDGVEEHATREQQRLIEENRRKGRVTGYWVPGMIEKGLRGIAIVDWFFTNLADDRTSVVVNGADRAQDTFAHELGHALGLRHEPTDDPNNLMTSGSDRKITGEGIDQLTPDQLAIIRSSIFMELGKKGVGQ